MNGWLDKCLKNVLVGCLEPREVCERSAEYNSAIQRAIQQIENLRYENGRRSRQFQQIDHQSDGVRKRGIGRARTRFHVGCAALGNDLDLVESLRVGSDRIGNFQSAAARGYGWAERGPRSVGQVVFVENLIL